MTSAALAIAGGEPVRTTPFPDPPGLGEAERRAVAEVLDDGLLSGFLAAPGEGFGGGPRVRALERAWAERFGAEHAVAMNSATSALYAAVAAAGAGPGDEVIVSPYTMTASATCALVHGAVPVFADVDPRTFTLDPESVAARISPRTRAIVAVDLFGCPADMDALMALAREHGLVVIEDAAQAPGALSHGRPAGMLGHVGVFSLNRHKAIQCGEGGVAVTDDPVLAERLALARNHGEAVGSADVLGFNNRMGELEAAIAEVQLGRLDELTAPRIAHAARMTEALSELDGITPPVVPHGYTHVFHVYATKLDPEIPRARFAAALRAEGVPVQEGYVAPLYRQPVYRSTALSCAYACPRYEGEAAYDDGRCPVTERLHETELLLHPHVHAGLSREDVEDVVAAFRKVHAAL